MARDRKRAKQRRARGGGAACAARRRRGRRRGVAPSEPTGGSAAGDARHARARRPARGARPRLRRGRRVRRRARARRRRRARRARHALRGEIEAEALAEGDFTEDELQEPAGRRAGGTGGGAGGGRGGGGGDASAEQASGAPLRGGNRAIGFLRASWAELQRVQWPDRRQVTQATAVVLGFVAIAGVFLGVADYRRQGNRRTHPLGR